MNVSKTIFKNAINLHLSRKTVDFIIIHNINNNNVILIEHDLAMLKEIKEAYKQDNLSISYFRLNGELLKIIQDFIDDIDYTLRGNAHKNDISLLTYRSSALFYIEENE